MSIRRAISRTPAIVWIALFAFLFWLAFPKPYPTLDAYYSMIWGGEIYNGHLPNYNFPYAQTPHLLPIAASAVLAIFGKSFTYEAMLAISYLSLGAIWWFIFQIGKRIGGWPAGLLALVMATGQDELNTLAAKAVIDIPTVALLLYALLLELRRPKCGLGVLAVLAVAGLLRPEVWVITGVYFLYVARGAGWPSRAKQAAIAAAAPLLWIGFDLVVTGNPLHSFQRTVDLGMELDRANSLGDLPAALSDSLIQLVGPAVLLCALPGLILAARLRRRDTYLTLSLLAVNVATFITLALLHLPLLERYLLVAAQIVTIFAAVAIVGWIRTAPVRARRLWALVALVSAILLVAQTPPRIEKLANARDKTNERGKINRNSKALVEGPAASRYLERCRPLYTQNFRPVAMFRFWLGWPAGSVSSAIGKDLQRGLIVTGISDRVVELVIGKPVEPGGRNAKVPQSFRRVASSRYWVLYASPSCLAQFSND